MLRILTFASMAFALTIGYATADDARKCPNAAELISRPAVSDVELAQAIQCLGTALEKEAIDKRNNDAAVIIELAGKIIGNGSPVADTWSGALAMAVGGPVPDVPLQTTQPGDSNHNLAGNIICQANGLLNKNPAEDIHLPTGFKCADAKEPTNEIIRLASKIIGNG